MVQGVVQGVVQGAVQGVVQGAVQGVVHGVVKGAVQGMAQRSNPANLTYNINASSTCNHVYISEWRSRDHNAAILKPGK